MSDLESATLQLDRVTTAEALRALATGIEELPDEGAGALLTRIRVHVQAIQRALEDVAKRP